MKKLLFTVVLATSVAALQAQVRNEIRIPDLNGYKTLKCDFHMHTVFSDGLVWPTVRVDEAYREGLDAIAITDHIESRPHREDIATSHNRAYEIALPYAKARDIILIKGSEITRSMPPGHFNAIYITDSEPLDKHEYLDAMKAAKDQGGFIFWNHPGWDAQQPDTTLWWKEHTGIFDKGFMQGIEVVNGRDYFPEVHRWCLDKELTMLGNSDIHQPIQTDIDFANGKHRSMTLVFAKDRSAESIREALLARRTAAYCDDMLIGEEVYLKEIFENSIEIRKEKRDNGVRITVKNNSDIPFKLVKTEHNPNLVYFRDYVLQPHSTHAINVRFLNNIQGGDLNFEITNLLVGPNQGLRYSYPL